MLNIILRSLHILLVVVLWHFATSNDVKDTQAEIKSGELLNSVMIGRNVLCSQHATSIVMDIISNQRTTIKNLVIFPTQDTHKELNNFDEFLMMLSAWSDKSLRVFPLRNSDDTSVNSVKLPRNSGEGEIDDATDDENVGKVAHFRVMAENITWSRGNRRHKLDYHPQMGGGYDLMGLGMDTILLFLYKSPELNHLAEIVAIQPNLIKILFTYGETWCNESRSFITEHLTDFMENQFQVRRNLFLYVVPLCGGHEQHHDGGHCCINNVFVYNAFWNHDNDTNAWGRLEERQPIGGKFCTTPQSMGGGDKTTRTSEGIHSSPVQMSGTVRETWQNFRDDTIDSGEMTSPGLHTSTCSPLQPKRHLKMNGYPLRLVFFPTAMAFLKANSTILQKQLSPEALEFPFNTTEAYFGLDVEVLKELSRRMNFTSTIMQTSDKKDYGYMESDGTFNGALGDVIYGRAEFIMNGFFVKDYETRQLEFSTVVDNDRLCIVVRTADLIPNSLLIAKCFGPIVWLVMLLTILIVGFSYHGLVAISLRIMKFNIGEIYNNVDERASEYYHIDTPHGGWSPLLNLHAAFRIIAIMLSAPVGRVGNTSHERLFVSVCLLWSLNLTGAFQGALVDVYTNPKSYRNIDTLEGLDKSGIPIAVLHAGLIVDVLGSEPPGTRLGNLRQKMFTFTEDNSVILSQIATKGDLAALQRLVDMPKIFQQFVRNDGVPLIHVISECPRSYRLGYLFPKSSIFLETASHYLSLFAQSGLIRKWFDDTMYIFTLEGSHQNRHFIKTQAIILTLSHLQTAFYILTLGLSISFITFLFELNRSKPTRNGN